MTEPSLLEIEDLKIGFPTPRGLHQVVRGVSLRIGREKVGIVGESGSGKSQTGRAVLKMTPKHARIEAKRMSFDGIDLHAASERQMRRIRGNRISMILQDPKFSLNPLIRVGTQVSEAYRLHHRINAAQARRRTLEMLESVRIRDPERVYRLFPHELSGGMGQRVMIAMMLISEPELIIADEPTSALDVTVRRQVMEVLGELVERRGAGLMLISHDLNLVAEYCDRVLVMYAGRIVEALPARELHQARHPYTRGLLESLPRLDRKRGLLPVLSRDPAWREAPSLPLEEIR
ncbi:ABC transporter ATP-binding protein [Halotalea alkalilenta]|uniref:ABC transporter ATP-binding protein n=1 Tax=Halotalea alkalilenta TaxID=376489 RepID=UPI000481DB2D|nr:ABC transporter ATP-binding protein [Halotalea alkalilenta]